MQLLKIFQKKIYLLLFLLFFFTLFIRMYDLGNLPYGFHRDEAINAYVGRFILLNGKDLYGNSWPIFYFDKFGDYPPILPMYLMGISTFLFGVNEFAARFPAALLGALIVFPVWDIAKRLYKNTAAAFLGAFFIAIMPWHIVLSRASSEGIMAVTCFVFGLSFLFKGLFDKKQGFLYLSGLFFFLTYFLYPSFRLLTPLSLLPLPFLVKEKAKKKFLAIFILAAFLLTLGISSTNWGRARFLQTSLFRNEGILKNLQIYSNDEGPNNITVARIFHNKLIGYSREFFHQYLSYFSTDLLFISGGIPYEYPVPDFGLLYIAFVPFFLGMLLFVEVPTQKSMYYYIWYLLFVAPLAAALTTDFVPHIHRTLFMTVPLALLLPLGFLKIQKTIGEKRKLLKASIIAVLLSSIVLESIYFFHQYASHTASFKSFFKNDGYLQVTAYVIANKDTYKKVIMPYASLPIYYLFYSHNFDSSFAGKFYKDLEIDDIENIHFLRTECPTEELAKAESNLENTLIVDEGNCKTPKGYREIGSIWRKDSTKAFSLLLKEPM